ncbi:MAG: DUF1211 domain-containing protein [Chloroflexi bacterium]|nr:DUF1211 domain-containing protein [Chloroflexota bacterium]OJV94661.1 MAG: hypothetical protein BGO39_23345 [Chloroflexi bacterium 54-19]
MEGKETSRLEAFSDGVIAIAITLLALEIKVPGEQPEGKSLWIALFDQWPTYLALVTTFVMILIMWINHHRMFSHIHRIDTVLMLLNGGILLGITILPFTTELVGEYLLKPDGQKQVAAIVYNGVFIFTAIFFNLAWRYASQKDRLLNPQADRDAVRGLTRQYMFGIPGYFITLLIALVNFPLSLVLTIFIAIFFAFPNKLFSGARVTGETGP